MTRSSKALLSLLAGCVLAGCAAKPAVRPDRPTTRPNTPPLAGAVPGVEVKDPSTQFEDALAALKAKRLPEARAGFALLAKEHPEFSGPLTNLGIMDAKTNSRDAAISNFARAVAANPRNAIAYNWLGMLYRENKDYLRAEQNYQKALQLNPDNAAVVLNLAILNDVYLRRPEEALRLYRDYQRRTNNRELKVAAWIKALELTVAATPTVPSAPLPAGVPAKPGKAVKAKS